MKEQITSVSHIYFRIELRSLIIHIVFHAQQSEFVARFAMSIIIRAPSQASLSLVLFGCREYNGATDSTSTCISGPQQTSSNRQLHKRSNSIVAVVVTERRRIVVAVVVAAAHAPCQCDGLLAAPSLF